MLKVFHTCHNTPSLISFVCTFIPEKNKPLSILISFPPTKNSPNLIDSTNYSIILSYLTQQLTPHRANSHHPKYISHHYRAISFCAKRARVNGRRPPGIHLLTRLRTRASARERRRVYYYATRCVDAGARDQSAPGERKSPAVYRGTLTPRRVSRASAPARE